MASLALKLPITKDSADGFTMISDAYKAELKDASVDQPRRKSYGTKLRCRT